MGKRENKSGILKSLKLLWKFMDKKDRTTFVLIFLFSIVSALPWMFFNVIPPLVLASLCGEPVKLLFLDLSSLPTIALVFLLIGTHIFLWMIGMLHYYTIDKFARKMICVVNIKAQDLLFLERVNLDFGMTNGEINYIIKNATDCVYQIIEPLCWNMLTNIIAVVFNMVILFSIDWLVGVIGLAMILLIFLAVFIRLKIQSPVIDKIENTNAKIGNQILTSIQNISLISVLKSQVNERIQLGFLNKIFYKFHKKRAKIGYFYWIAIIFIEYLAIAFGVWAFIARGSSTQVIASVTMIFTILYDIQNTIESWGYELGDIQAAAIKLCNLEVLVPSSQRIKKGENFKNQALHNENFKSIEILNYKVQLGQFKHTYHAKFQSGKTYLLSGESGCGKTTLINALCGIRDVKSGAILVNNKYNLMSLENFSDKISYMFQSSILFDRSIKENLAYPDKELNSKAKQLIKTFCMNKILERESEGRDVKQILSGGEKKRIDFIRTLSKEADVYFFDEPTNELDIKNVEKVFNEIKKLKENNKICVIISHDKRILPIIDEVIEL